jgi:hypothetical protein
MIKWDRLLYLVTIGVFLHLGIQLPAQGVKAIKIRVKSMLERPKNFDKKTVEVDACVFTDWMHYIILLDKESDSQGVALVIPSKLLNEDESVKTFVRELYASPRGEPIHVRRKFVGTFRWHPGHVPSRVLVLEGLTDK